MLWAWGASFLLAQEGLGDTAIWRAQRQTVSSYREGGLCQQTEMPRLRFRGRLRNSWRKDRERLIRKEAPCSVLWLLGW